MSRPTVTQALLDALKAWLAACDDDHGTINALNAARESARDVLRQAEGRDRAVTIDEQEAQIMAANALLEQAWGIIANAGAGNWQRESQEWRDAAERWRDAYFASQVGK